MSNPFKQPLVVGAGISFFYGAAKSVLQNKNLISNTTLENEIFLLTVTTLKDSGILKTLLGSSVTGVGGIGLLASIVFGIGWHISNSHQKSWFTTAITGGAISTSLLGYGLYKIGEGVGDVAVSTVATVTRG